MSTPSVTGSTIHVKLFHGQEVRRFAILDTLSLQEFQAFLAGKVLPELTNVPYYVEYKDEDGDWVRLSIDEEWYVALEVAMLAQGNIAIRTVIVQKEEEQQEQQQACGSQDEKAEACQQSGGFFKPWFNKMKNAYHQKHANSAENCHGEQQQQQGCTVKKFHHGHGFGHRWGKWNKCQTQQQQGCTAEQQQEQQSQGHCRSAWNHQEMQQKDQELQQMGFTNKQKNYRLLYRFQGDVNKVVENLTVNYQ